VHRDIKSPNVLVSSSDPRRVCLKIADFGTATLCPTFLKEQVVFNPIWCAPEVLNQQYYNEKIDVFSFGIILWELYTLKRPYEALDRVAAIQDFLLGGNRLSIPAPTNLVEKTWSELIPFLWHDKDYLRPDLHRILPYFLDRLALLNPFSGTIRASIDTLYEDREKLLVSAGDSKHHF